MDPAHLIDTANEMRYLKHSKIHMVKPRQSQPPAIATVADTDVIGEFVDEPFLSSLPDLVYDGRSPCDMIGDSTRMHRRK